MTKARSRAVRIAAILALSAGLRSQFTPPAASAATPAAAPAPKPRLAFFYRPPVDGASARYLALHFQLIILTHTDEPYMAELRRAGYGGPILQYIAANEAEGPGPYANHSAPCDSRYPTYQRTVADRVGVFCSEIHPHENWFLHNARGERLWTRYRSPSDGVWRTTYDMNPGSAGWRKFLLHRLRQYRKLGWNGFFLDNVDLSRDGLLRQPTDHGGLREYADDSSFRAAEIGYLQALRKAFPHVPIWANLTHDPQQPGNWTAYLQSLDGLMIEDFALGWRASPLAPADRAVQMANARAALLAGKGVLAVVQGQPQETARRAAGLAAWRELEAAAPALKRGSPQRPQGLYYRYADAFFDDYRTIH